MEPIQIDERYTLLAAIGQGGEARVFRARDAATQREVAVRLGSTPGTVASRIVQAPADYHRGWVRLLDAGIDVTQGSYQVFELLSGQTLGQIVPGAGLEKNALVDCMRQSLEAVEALHRAGYVHGDLNADNFFLATDGWKILELPFARFEPPPGRSPVFGSIHTLAPEQIDGGAPTVATDLYALGCLYYFAASGAWPHPGSSYAEVAIHTLRFPPEPLPDRPGGLEADCRAGVMKMLATKSADRPESAAAARRLLGVA